MTCSECDGVGSLSLGHPLDPNAGVVECERCDGTGRLCRECREPLPVTFPDGAECCRECETAMAEDEAEADEEAERRQTLLGLARQARNTRLSMEARQMAGSTLAVMVERFFGGGQ